jgi:Rieske Fe-S protein
MNVERRTVLQVGGIAAVGLVAAACSTGSESSSSSAATTAPPETPAPESAPASSAAAAGGAAVAQVSDIPVGGGVILPDEAIVITQPNDGDVKAFSAICTHQGCLVSEVIDNEIICPCHGSRFSAADGAVITGPATQALPSAGIAVEGGSVVLS